MGLLPGRLLLPFSVQALEGLRRYGAPSRGQGQRPRLKTNSSLSLVPNPNLIPTPTLALVLT